MNNEQKRKYHAMMSLRAKKLNDTELAKWYIKMHERLKKNSSLPNYYSPEHEHGEKSIMGIETSKEEYDNMDKADRVKFHNRHRDRHRRDNNIELSKFHNRMSQRLQRNSSLHNYYSPEHEQEEQ